MKFTREVSRLFWWGFAGTAVSPSVRSLLKKYPISGMILFRRNIESIVQMRSLTKALKAAGGRNFLIAIDEEGGRVSRVPPGTMKFPPARFFGDLYRRTRDLKVIEHFGRILGKELKWLGVNTDFAPILDVDSNPKNPIIGDRAYSKNPESSAKVALAFQKGLAKEGILTCGKHFPGHGDTETDSHLTLPRVKRGKRSLETTELVPFRRAVAAQVPMIMTAHVVYDALDPKLPATLSPKILTGLLRERLGYRGVIISDDLKMKAIAQKYSEAEAAVLALEAGCDLILICEDFEKIGARVMEKVAREIQKSSVLTRRFEESLRRVRGLKLRS